MQLDWGGRECTSGATDRRHCVTAAVPLGERCIGARAVAATAAPRPSCFRCIGAGVVASELELAMLAVLASEQQDKRADVRLASEEPGERRGVCRVSRTVSTLVNRRSAGVSAAAGEPPRSPRRGELRGDRAFRPPTAGSASLLGMPVMGARQRDGRQTVDDVPFFSVLLSWSKMWNVALLSRTLFLTSSWAARSSVLSRSASATAAARASSAA